MPRPTKELELACATLTHVLKRGPIVASELLTMIPVSMHTLRRAKKKLGLVAVKTKRGWLWKLPKPEQSAYVDIFSIPGIEPYDKTLERIESEEPMRMTTEDIIELTKFNRIKDIHEIIAEACLTAATYPQKIPYSKEYIESVVRHVIDNTPIKHELNKNEK